MLDIEVVEKTFSHTDEHDVYDPVEFDPETTFVDEELDSDALAFRDASRDIWTSEGRFEVLLY
ncbi:MAG: hypothetical protein JWN44_1032 [Myxococcales bacterium]|nr:hypothetical protein [Myxococcales bacterium]